MRVRGTLPTGWRGSWRRFRLVREARARMRRLFDEPQLLEGTSLRSSHRGRVYLFEIEVREATLVGFMFTILRHPRPYAFSRQFHEVVESYTFDIRSGTLTRGKSLNLSRLKGRDGEP